MEARVLGERITASINLRILLEKEVVWDGLHHSRQEGGKYETPSNAERHRDQLVNAVR